MLPSERIIEIESHYNTQWPRTLSCAILTFLDEQAEKAILPQGKNDTIKNFNSPVEAVNYFKEIVFDKNTNLIIWICDNWTRIQLEGKLWEDSLSLYKVKLAMPPEYFEQENTKTTKTLEEVLAVIPEIEFAYNQEDYIKNETKRQIIIAIKQLYNPK